MQMTDKFLPGSLSVWMQKRESSDELDGKLEFPGGKVEPKKRPRPRRLRELRRGDRRHGLTRDLNSI